MFRLRFDTRRIYVYDNRQLDPKDTMRCIVGKLKMVCATKSDDEGIEKLRRVVGAYIVEKRVVQVCSNGCYQNSCLSTPNAAHREEDIVLERMRVRKREREEEEGKARKEENEAKREKDKVELAGGCNFYVPSAIPGMGQYTVHRGI